MIASLGCVAIGPPGDVAVAAETPTVAFAGGNRLRVSAGGGVTVRFGTISAAVPARVRLVHHAGLQLAVRSVTLRPGLRSMRLHLDARARRHVTAAGGTSADLRIALGEPRGSAGAPKRQLVLLPSLCRSDAARLVGRRVKVPVVQLLTYDDPARSYTGSLQRGQSFAVRRLSPTGTFAYGFAFGKVDKTVWVRTAKLLGCG